VSRFQYPTNTRTIRVLCTGQVDPTYLLKAFKHGADGVMVIGCRLGECHYITGNLHARWKVDLTKRMIEKIGMSTERLEMRFISSAEGTKYIEAVKEFTDKVKSLGPTPIKSKEKGEKIKRAIDSLISTASGYRIRAVVAKIQKMMEEGNVYNEKIPQEEIEKIIEDTVNTEFVRQSILLCLRENTSSCVKLSEKINVSPDIILSHLSHLRRNNLIDVDRVEERVPLYKVL